MRISWWGHSSVTVSLAGVRILTDPVLTRVAGLSRQCGLPPALAADADVVVISHLHSDHLHLPSLRRLGNATRLIAPLGAAGVLVRRLPALAERVEEVEPGDVLQVAGIEVRAVPAEHDGRRHPGSRHAGPALSFLFATVAERVWFAGDTGLFDGMRELGPVDVCLVPVGGWGPTLGPEHLDPAQAAEAVARVGARHAVPLHYATLWPIGLRSLAPGLYRRKCLEPGRRFQDALAGSPARAHLLQPGSSVQIEVERL
jgi:L-ascorbate metabolism protein UlaG (beta-lactamase superfamily)